MNLRSLGFFYCLVLIAQGGCLPNSGREGLVVSPEVLYLTALNAEGIGVYEFSVKNCSLQPIQIEEIRPSCACIQLENISGNPDQVLLPGTEVVLRATASMNEEMPFQKGSVVIAYRMDDGRKDRVKGSFELRLPTEFKLIPETVNFGYLSVDSAPSKRIELHLVREDDESPIRIVKCESLSPYLNVETSDTSIIVQLKEDAGKAVGMYHGLIRAETTSVRRKFVAIPVEWRVIKPITIDPEILVISEHSKGRFSVCITTIRPTRILELKLPQFLSASKMADEIGFANSHAFELIVPDNAEGFSHSPGAIGSVDIQLRFDDGEVGVFSVPIYALN